MNKIIRFFLSLFVLTSVIVIHELGHLTVAKIVDFEIEAFSLGFGPPIIAKNNGELEWRIGIIPLGGYVALSEKGQKSLLKASVYKKWPFYLGGIFLNWYFPVLLLFIFSKRYREGNRYYPRTFIRSEVLRKRRLKFPLLGPFYAFRELMTPVNKESGLKEEYLWKFKDISRLIATFNLFPIPFLDGGRIFGDICLMVNNRTILIIGLFFNLIILFLWLYFVMKIKPLKRS